MWRAILATPSRVRDAWLDPVRRRHSVSRILEGYVPALGILLWLGHGWASLGWAALVVAGEFVLFEFALELTGKVGHYWERGPSDDEEFSRP